MHIDTAYIKKIRKYLLKWYQNHHHRLPWRETDNPYRIWVSEVINHGFIHSIYTFDPNNIPIEFSAPVPDVDIRKHPKLKDKRPTSVGQEGSESQSGHWPENGEPIPYEDRKIYPGEGVILAEDDDLPR